MQRIDGVLVALTLEKIPDCVRHFRANTPAFLELSTTDTPDASRL
jgi:hypothetical protein